MDLADLDGVVSKIVMNDERQILEAREEAENFQVIVQELLLAFNPATTQLFFKEFLHLLIFFHNDRLLRVVERVLSSLLGRRLRSSNILSNELIKLTMK